MSRPILALSFLLLSLPLAASLRFRTQSRRCGIIGVANLLVFNLMLCAGILAGTMARKGYRVLLMAYLAGTALVGLGWLLSQASPNLQEVMFVALVRVAVAPMLVTVMVVAVLESSALFQANSGEVPDGIVARMPPPGDVKRPD